MSNDAKLGELNTETICGISDSAEGVAYGYVTVGPRHTGGLCTGVWLRVASTDPLNFALRHKGVANVQLTSGDDSSIFFEATATFDHKNPASYRFTGPNGEEHTFEATAKHRQSLIVEVTDKHVPDRLWREIADKPAGYKLPLEATLSANGVLRMAVPAPRAA